MNFELYTKQNYFRHAFNHLHFFIKIRFSLFFRERGDDTGAKKKKKRQKKKKKTGTTEAAQDPLAKAWNNFFGFEKLSEVQEQITTYRGLLSVEHHTRMANNQAKVINNVDLLFVIDFIFLFFSLLFQMSCLTSWTGEFTASW